MSRELPPVPSIDANLLGAYVRAHAALEETRHETDPRIDLLFRRFAVETTCESIASIAPTFRGGAVPPLLPAPRAFLSRTDLARIDGVRAGLQYLDSRLAMVAQGHDTASLLPESPYVLHALAEGRVDNPQVTNPGIVRATDVRQVADVFRFPEPNEARTLFEQAVAVATTVRAPACVRAAWLMYATIFIHPFCDGNGRLSRLLYLLVAGVELPAAVDWGIGEQLTARREAFTYSGPSHELEAAIDLTPLVAFVTRASADGATLMRHRLLVLGDIDRHLARQLPADVDATAVVAVALRRTAPADVLAADLGIGYGEAIQRLSALVAAGSITRVPTPPSRRWPGPARPSFALSADASAAVTAVVARAIAIARLH